MSIFFQSIGSDWLLQVFHARKAAWPALTGPVRRDELLSCSEQPVNDLDGLVATPCQCSVVGHEEHGRAMLAIETAQQFEHQIGRAHV